MPLYSYRAKSADGSEKAGTLTADTERAAVEAISRMGAFPVEVRERRGPIEWKLPKLDIGGARARPMDVAMFTLQLADLLKAGVPLLRSLQTLQKQSERRALGPVLDRIAKDVASGRTLHEAMADFPREFPRLYTSIVRAGETGGFLDESLRRVGGFLERDIELRQRIAAALAYPILLLVLGFISVTVLLIFFIPKFSGIFEQFQGATLPWMTRVVIALGGFVREGWMWILGAVGAGALGIRAASTTAAGRRFFEALRLHTPVLGDAARKRMVARFARTLGSLLHNGVPMVEALGIARDSLDSAVYAPTMDEVIAGVKQGKPLAQGLGATGLFPPEVQDMVAVGEEAATLDEVLIGVADSYERRVDRAMRVFVSLFEPVLLVIMAGIVGFIVISMLVPVFTLSQTVR